MVLPAMIAVAVGAQAVSGIMQYYQAEKARGANAKRLREIEAMFAKIVPPEMDISIYDDPRVAESIPEPLLDFSAITPKEFKSVGQFVPEVASYVAETNPQLVEATAAATKGRQTQLEALSKYREIASQGGMDPILASKLAVASDKARSDAASSQQSILQDAQRRGMMGSGLQMQSQMNRTAEDMRRQAVESQMAAAEAYRNQMDAMARGAALGGDIRGSEMSEQGRNADIINAFNERTSRRYQDYLQARSDAVNRANLRNLESQQELANRNVTQGNKAARYNRNMANQGATQQWQNKRASRQDLLDLDRAKKADIQQNWQNKMTHAGAMKGISQDWQNHNYQTAQDRNQATRGIADAVSGGAMYYGKQPQAAAPAPEPQPTGYDGEENEWGDVWKRRQDNQRW